MPFAKTRKGLLVFAHVPRCGGSSVENYLAGRFGKLAFLDRGHGSRDPATVWNRTSPQHMDRDTLDRLLPPKLRFACFAVVRHPATRLQSVYLHNRDITGGIAPDVPFEDWLAGLAQAPAGYLDHHARAMDDLVPADATVFKLENGMGAVETWLDSLMGSVAKRHIKHVHGRDQLHANRGRTAKPHAISAEALEMIENIFATDYERFEYERAAPVSQAQDE